MVLAIEDVPGPPADRRQPADTSVPARSKVKVTAALSRYYRRAKHSREIERLIRVAPTASIRDDLMAIAARNELSD